MNRYGELIELLIALKDGHRGELSLGEVDAINRACNILEVVGEKKSEATPHSLSGAYSIRSPG